ncbi:DUF3618 domain-containing protein [Trueperella bernardiae]|uniref:DUF3618 domain-containing protein n=1 Tax=Trueperella bernardiae TaxID=59561 RepID=UPI000837B9F2|nr:DUF3618 domain-containing protein [Trueperella bernardiae]OCW60625.1 hypothetical protein AKG36_02720 [Trueperella bernardiae]
MTNVSQKKAVDYEAPKGIEDTRTADEVDADMQRVREELTATVNELAGKLHPDNLKEEARAYAEERLSQGKEQALGLVDDAKAGDKKALAIIGTTLAVVALFVIRKIIK